MNTQKLIEALEEADRLLNNAKPYMTDPFCVRKAIEYIKGQEESGKDEAKESDKEEH